MKKYLWMSSAAVVIGALRVNTQNVPSGFMESSQLQSACKNNETLRFFEPFILVINKIKIYFLNHISNVLKINLVIK